MILYLLVSSTSSKDAFFRVCAFFFFGFCLHYLYFFYSLIVYLMLLNIYDLEKAHENNSLTWICCRSYVISLFSLILYLMFLSMILMKMKMTILHSMLQILSCFYDLKLFFRFCLQFSSIINKITWERTQFDCGFRRKSIANICVNVSISYVHIHVLQSFSFLIYSFIEAVLISRK